MNAVLNWTGRNFRFTMWNLGWLLVSTIASMASHNWSWMMMFVIAMTFSLIARAEYLPAVVEGLTDFGKWLWGVAKQLWSWVMDNKVMAWIIVSVVVTIVSFLKADWATFWLAFISTIAGFITFFGWWGGLGEFFGKISIRMISGRWGRTTQGLTIGFPLFIVGLVMMQFPLVSGLGLLVGMAGFIAISVALFGGFASKVNTWNASRQSKKPRVRTARTRRVRP